MNSTDILIKICYKCHTKKSIYGFYKDRTRKDGHSAECKSCNKIRKALYWKNKKAKLGPTKNEKQRKYRETIGGRLAYRFSNIKNRCRNPYNKDYKRYGGRGIECKFENADEFIEHILNDLQIDRINNNGHYEKGNIRLTTAKEQANNRRDNI